MISPETGKDNRNLINKYRAKIASSIGPGRYSINLSSFPKQTLSKPGTFGSAARKFKISDMVEMSLKKSKTRRANLDLPRESLKQISNDPHQTSVVNQKLSLKKKIDFRLSVEKTPGP